MAHSLVVFFSGLFPVPQLRRDFVSAPRLFPRKHLREDNAAHSSLGDKVGNAPLFYPAREGAANEVRG